ncbi:MAG: serine/threonine-protein kinase [Planctomycetaceae bacterium]
MPEDTSPEPRSEDQQVTPRNPSPPQPGSGSTELEATFVAPRSPFETVAPDSIKPADPHATLDSTVPGTGNSANRFVRYFGDYELIEEIARGGMGVVYKARQVNLNRTVALKMILSGHLATETDIQRFRAEAEAAANLDHPGIVPIFEIGQHDGQHYFSMGFIDGQSLSQRVKDGPLEPKLAAELTRKIAEAIAYAHEKGVIHRDLKPANVLLDSVGEPRVTDFGLARRMESDSGLTKTGDILGTPGYMSPEQAAGRTPEVGPQSDVYSLGALLYCLLTGRPPFLAASSYDTIRQVIECPPAPVQTLNSDVPADLEVICMKCLEKAAKDRIESASGLSNELQRFLRNEPIRSRRHSIVERVRRWCSRHPAETALIITIMLCAVLMGVLIGLVAFGQSRTKRLAGSDGTSVLAIAPLIAGPLLTTGRMVGLEAIGKAEHRLLAILPCIPAYLLTICRLLLNYLCVTMVMILLCSLSVFYQASLASGNPDSWHIGLGISGFLVVVFAWIFDLNKLRNTAALLAIAQVGCIYCFGESSLANGISPTSLNGIMVVFTITTLVMAFVSNAVWVTITARMSWSAFHNAVDSLRQTPRFLPMFMPRSRPRYRMVNGFLLWNMSPFILLGAMSLLFLYPAILLLMIPLWAAEKLRAILAPQYAIFSEGLAWVVSLITGVAAVSQFFLRH